MMNDLVRNVLTRRSVRNFDARQISDFELNVIIEAGQFLSEGKEDPLWHFTVIQNSVVLKRVEEISLRLLPHGGQEHMKELHGGARFNLFGNAPTMIIISGRRRDMEMQDAASIAFGNMMLAADNIGVSACWTHSVEMLFRRAEGAEIIEEIGIPEDYAPMSAGVFGYKEKAAMELTIFNHRMVHIIR